MTSSADERSPSFSKRSAKSTWTEDEDKLLFEIVSIHGPKNWPLIAQSLPGRSGKQCRERFKNHLDPHVNKDPFTIEEDMQIIRMVEEMGPKWAILATQMTGRTDNAIKNRYNSSLRRAHEEGKFKDLLADVIPYTPSSPGSESRSPSLSRRSVRDSPKRKRHVIAFTHQDSDDDEIDEESEYSSDSSCHSSRSRSSSISSTTSNSNLLCSRSLSSRTSRNKRHQKEPLDLDEVGSPVPSKHGSRWKTDLCQEELEEEFALASVEDPEIILDAAKLLCELREIKLSA